MYVKKISLKNFKSFKQGNVQLGNSFNCIVGPNGSGKCLRGDAKVFLSNGFSVTIRELVESQISSSSVTIMDDGVCCSGAEVFAYSLNPLSLKIEVKRIEKFIKRTAPRELFELETGSGKKVVATSYHPVMVRQEKGIRAINADELREGMEVACVPDLLSLAGGKGSVCFEKLSSIKKMKTGKEEWVYDLTIVDNHNFLAEGIFVHNSNVIDALLFAFGESSLKSMRVKKTADLIFEDHGVAEVGVELLDKDDREKHEVKRLIRKDGKTKYMLDGKRIKKYVLEEFLSKNRISLNNIIKQGEVQRIVEMNSKERRTLIDFVANVSEYEEKKKEAYSELQRVENKLAESQTLLGERMGYLKELEEEKAQAEKFLELDGRRKSAEATLLHVDIQEHSKEFEGVVNSVIDLNARIDNVKQSLSEKEKEISDLQNAKDEINREITSRGEGKELGLQKEIDNLNASISSSKTLIEAKKQELEKVKLRNRELQVERTKAEDEVKGCNSRIRQLGEESESVKKLVEEEALKYRNLEQQSSAFGTAFQDARRLVEQTQEEMLKLKEELSALQAEVGKLEEVKKLKEAELQRLKFGEFEDLSPRLKALQQNLQQAEKDFEAIDFQLTSLMKQEKEDNEKVNVLEDLILAAKDKAIEISHKLRSGGAIESAKSVEALAELREKVPGIHGTVEQLCKYESEYSVPISVAFGSRANFIIVDNTKVAGKAIEVLKSRKMGRASFIPLDKIRVNEVRREDLELVDKAKGSRGFVIDLIKYEEKFDKAFKFVCSNTVLFDRFENAEVHTGKGTRMVTLQGELFEGSGLIAGGSVHEKINVMREQKELEEWERKHQESKNEKDRLMSELYSLRDQGSQLRKKKADAELRVKTIELEIRHSQEQGKQEEEKRKNLKKAMDQLRDEIEDSIKSIAKFDDDRNEHIRKLSELNIRHLEAKQKIDVEKEKHYGTLIKQVEHSLSELRIQHSDLSNQLQAIENSKKVYESQLSSVLKQLSEVKEEEGQCEDSMKQADKQIKADAEALKEKISEQKKISGALQELLEKRESFDKRIEKISYDKGKLGFEAEKLSSQLQEKQVSRATVETQLSGLKAQFMEFEGVALLELKGGESAHEGKVRLLVEMKKLKEEIGSMGNINLKAIEQYEQRAAELIEQRKKVEQLVNEKEAVIQIINEIEGKKIGTFMETYNMINQNFSQLFKQIFPGKGSLLLENEVNPFEGGLTIQVQLENKEVKYLELMSGGEKSLVALMFLFAIQANNPSSIYILDEADAALDQENSRKLGLLVRELSKQSQFLVVSHNEAVYKTSSCLVGVAMNGKEGSKLVEVKLSE